MKGRRPHKPRRGVSRCPCSKSDRILALTPTRLGLPCRWKEAQK
jgi:hypothetical protein